MSHSASPPQRRTHSSDALLYEELIAIDAKCGQGPVSAVSEVVSRTWDGRPLVLALELSPRMRAGVAARIVRLIACIAASRPEHAQNLCASLAVRRSLALLEKGPPQPLATALVQLAAAAGALRLASDEARSLIALCSGGEALVRQLLLGVLVDMAKGYDGGGGGDMTFARLCGDAGFEIGSVEMRGWPPVAGWGFACWVRVESWGGRGLRLTRLSAAKRGGGDKAGDAVHVSEVWANRDGQGFVSFQTGTSGWIQFSSFTLQVALPSSPPPAHLSRVLFHHNPTSLERGGSPATALPLAICPVSLFVSDL